jgi:Fur family ferric uptake transcriptional regulator
MARVLNAARKSPIVSKLAEIERRCADNKLRMTEQRRVLLRVIAEARDHPDVEELHRRVQAIEPDVALSTVYRAVRLLEAIGDRRIAAARLHPRPFAL